MELAGSRHIYKVLSVKRGKKEDLVAVDFEEERRRTMGERLLIPWEWVKGGLRQVEEAEFSLRHGEYEVPTGIIQVNVSRKLKL